MFERIFYINLDMRPDREKHMRKTLAPCPCPVQRISGIRLNAPPERLGLQMIPRLEGEAGVAGIFLSHLRVLEEAVSAGIKGGIAVLEDDVRIDPAFWRMELSEILPPFDHDILFLSPRYRLKQKDEKGNSIFVTAPFGPGFVDLAEAMKSHIVTGAHFLIFPSPDAVRKAIVKMKACKELVDVDLFFILNLRCFGIHLDAVGTAPLGSDHVHSGLN